MPATEARLNLEAGLFVGPVRVAVVLGIISSIAIGGTGAAGASPVLPAPQLPAAATVPGRASAAAVQPSTPAVLPHASKAAATTGARFVPTAPTRLLDTRLHLGGSAPTARGTLTLPILGNGPVPTADVTAVVLNVTVTAPTAAGYLTVYGKGTAPTASNLNFQRGQTIPNLVVVPVGSDGKIRFYNGSSGTTPLIADITGWFTTAATTGATFAPTAPTRLLDTRLHLGGSAPTARGTLTLPILGNGPVPTADVTAVVLNVTVTAPTAAGYLTVYGKGTAPTASNLNFQRGQTIPNLVVVPVGSDGKIRFYNGSSGTTPLIADITGWFTTAGPDTSAPPAPDRVVAVSSAGRVDLAWPAVTAADLGGYRIYRLGPSDPSWSQVATVPAPTTAYSATNLADDTTYQFGVSSVDVAGNESQRATTTATTPPGNPNGSSSVTAVRATGLSLTGVTLRWTNASVSDLGGVVIRRAMGSTPPTSVTDGDAAVTTAPAVDEWTDGGLRPGQTYSYALFTQLPDNQVAAPGVVTVRIAVAADISGKVTDAAGTALTGVAVVVLRRDGSGGTDTTTGAGGTWSVAGLPDGAYTVCFDPGAVNRSTSGSGYLAACWSETGSGPAGTITVGSTPVTGVDGVLGTGAAVSGTVTDARGPVAGVAAALNGSDGDPVGFATTGSDGRWRVAGLPTGAYTACFDPSGATGATAYAAICHQDSTGALLTVTATAGSTATGIDVVLGLVGLPGGSGSTSPGPHAAGGLRELPSTSLGSLPCADVFFLAARGSGESGPGGTRDDSADPDLGVGGPVYAAYAKFVATMPATNAKLGRLADGRTVTPPVSVSYPADNVYTPVMVNGAYFRDLASGVAEARRTLVARAQRCPNERIVMSGFSQGAMLVHRLLNDAPVASGPYLDTATHARMDAAIVIGDGDRVSNDTTRMYGSAPNSAYGIGTHFPGISDAVNRKLPGAVGTRVFSVCNSNDPVCDLSVPWVCGIGVVLPVSVLQCALEAEITYVFAVHLRYRDSGALASAAQDASRWEQTFAGVGGAALRITGNVDEPLQLQLPVTLAASQYRSLAWTAPTGTLPAGVTLSSSGLVSGTPQVVKSGTISLLLTRTDTHGAVEKSTVVGSITIVGGGQFPLTLSPDSLGALRVWEPVDVQLTATGGRAPYRFAATDSSTYGLTVSSSGQLRGTPTYAGDVTLTFSVTDAADRIGTATLALSVDYGNAPSVAGSAHRLTAGNSSSFVEDVSRDGRWVLVSTYATNLGTDPDCHQSSNLLLIASDSGEIRCIAGSASVGFISADERYVVFGRPTSSTDSDIARYSIADATVESVVGMSGTTRPQLSSISGDGTKIAYAYYRHPDDANSAYGLYVRDTVAGTTVEISTQADQDYQNASSFTTDGSSFAYTAAPVGTNYVPFIRVRNLVDGTEQSYRVQTTETPEISGDGSFVAFETYHGFFNSGQAVLFASGSVEYLDDGVNGVFDGKVPWAGTCIGVKSWEPTKLTADHPNRGVAYYLSDVFTYGVTSQGYSRVTNTFEDDITWDEAVSDDCGTVAFAATSAALVAHAAYGVQDVWVTDLS